MAHYKSSTFRPQLALVVCFEVALIFSNPALCPRTQRFLSGPFAPGVDISAQVLVVSNDGRLLFSGGHWDCSLRVTQLAKGKLVGRICRHVGEFWWLSVLEEYLYFALLRIYLCFCVFFEDVVTCLALDLCGIYLISGSRDTSCIVWQVLQQVIIFMLSLTHMQQL